MDIKLDFKDVLIRPKRSTLKSRSQVELQRTMTFRHSRRTMTCVPVMAANMDTTGTFDIATVMAKHHAITCLHKHYTPDQIVEFATSNPSVASYCAVSMGTSAADFAKVSAVLEQTAAATKGEIHAVCLDVANGYSEYFVDIVRKVRERHARATIFAGNVVTGEMVEELILTGADAVKIGIGPGSVCTTRRQTGVGYPQLSAVIECADAAHGLGGHVISDGGCKCPGDFAKAFGAGADFVMAGGVFAGHDESGGELVVDDSGKKFKQFYGMSSTTAMQKHSGGVANYRSSEGKAVIVPYRGPVEATIVDLLGGLRSACTYVGAARLKELPKRTTFIRCTQQLNPSFNAGNSMDVSKRAGKDVAYSNGAPPPAAPVAAVRASEETAEAASKGN
jgi:GMP reductase